MRITVRKTKQNSFLQATGDSKLKNKVYYPGAKTVIMAPLDDRNGVFPKTGLTEEDERRLELDLGYAVGELKVTSKFWSTFSVTIPENGLELDTEVPLEELMWKVLTQSKLVANNLQELYENEAAEFVMTNATQEAEVRNKKRDSKKRAWAVVNKMSLDEQRDYLIAKGVYGVEVLSNSRVQDMVETDAEDNPKEFIEFVEDPTYKDRIFIAALVNAGILRMRGTRYLDRENLPLAHNKEGMIDYINNPKNANIVAILMDSLEKYKGGEVTDKINTKKTKPKE